MIYQSTRHNHETATASQAILRGIAPDGGLYTPTSIPSLNVPLHELATMSYQEVAFIVLRAFLTDFTDDELKECITQAYSQHNFDTPDITPIHSIGNKHYLELFHGQTIAFKDMALSILPYLMTVAARKNNSNKKILILTATSGDTGKAAMAGFADVPNTKIIVFYPKGGVSPIQEKQMVTQTGENTHVIGITGNFDDAQSAVKRMFTDTQLAETISEKGYQFSSANSINIGRLTPQIAYYVYAYAQLIKSGKIQAGDPINIAVPTGNFGNILAAYYAKEMGLPISTLICASNKNNVLTEFFQTRRYDKNRPFYVTNSPSMDIVLSSNLERLVFHATGNDAEKTAELMNELAHHGCYTIDEQIAHHFSNIFADYADESDILSSIKHSFDTHHYVIDPHTAVADIVTDRYIQKTQDATPIIIASTASPYKFPRSVMDALGENDTTDDLILVDKLEAYSHISQPQAVLAIKDAPIRHQSVISVEDMEKSVLNCL
ncbi:MULTISPECIES: threonine synthase [unclassified Granulicatella]|uniref:threonine synthase n=1 Tax=unclassified Granulicatella TaxID=2630493 RepID=UPI00107320E7|nr:MULTISPECIES: threonine synthase [unclassified Granulicatella]MBF0779492.1 threonine synthase [Granulicatella sp. 19428wC4_WM01]TFU96458.1 threonine synthase [Granulicatella sp. WM01]